MANRQRNGLPPMLRFLPRDMSPLSGQRHAVLATRFLLLQTARQMLAAWVTRGQELRVLDLGHGANAMTCQASELAVQLGAGKVLLLGLDKDEDGQDEAFHRALGHAASVAGFRQPGHEDPRPRLTERALQNLGGTDAMGHEVVLLDVNRTRREPHRDRYLPREAVEVRLHWADLAHPETMAQALRHYSPSWHLACAWLVLNQAATSMAELRHIFHQVAASLAPGGVMAATVLSLPALCQARAAAQLGEYGEWEYVSPHDQQARYFKVKFPEEWRFVQAGPPPGGRRRERGEEENREIYFGTRTRGAPEITFFTDHVFTEGELNKAARDAGLEPEKLRGKDVPSFLNAWAASITNRNAPILERGVMPALDAEVVTFFRPMMWRKRAPGGRK